NLPLNMPMTMAPASLAARSAVSISWLYKRFSLIDNPYHFDIETFRCANGERIEIEKQTHEPAVRSSDGQLALVALRGPRPNHFFDGSLRISRLKIDTSRGIFE